MSIDSIARGLAAATSGSLLKVAVDPGVTAGTVTVAGSATVGGVGISGATITVLKNGASAGTATSGSDGRWSLAGVVVAAGDVITAQAAAVVRAQSQTIPGGGAVAPANTSLPTISGTVALGSVLAATSGVWTGSPGPTYAYQWRRNGTNISGATASTYTVAAADLGATLTCRVTATNVAGSANATSAATAAVSALLNITNRTQAWNVFTPSITEIMTRNGYKAQDALVAGQWRVVVPAWVSNLSGPDGLYTADATVEMSVEYPVGTTSTRVQFSATNIGNISANGQIVSDPINVNVPAGTIFCLRVYRNSAGGQGMLSSTSGIQNSAGYFDRGDVTAAAVNGVDNVGTTNIGNTQGSANIGPMVGILQTTTSRPAWMLINDSRGLGFGDTQDADATDGNFGYGRTIGREGPLMNMSLGADRAAYWVANATKRRLMAQYATDIVIGLGTNDLRAATAGDASAVTTLIANTQAIKATIDALYPGRRYYLATLSSFEPANGATNTTPHANNDLRASFNAQVRAGSIPGFTGYFELAAPLETALDSGLWGSLTYCYGTGGDYLHLSQAGYKLLSSASRLTLY